MKSVAHEVFVFKIRPEDGFAWRALVAKLSCKLFEVGLIGYFIHVVYNGFGSYLFTA